jgi:hypothetical protein
MLKYLENFIFYFVTIVLLYCKKNKSRQTFRILAHWKLSGNMFKKIHHIRHIQASHGNKKYIF